MKLIFVDESWEDYLYWQKTDKKKLKRINELIKDISRNPFDGILQGELPGSEFDPAIFGGITNQQLQPLTKFLVPLVTPC